jgi:hypothetical protein
VHLELLSYLCIRKRNKKQIKSQDPEGHREIMTARQRNLGVTTYGIEECKNGNYFANSDAFLARISTYKKGQYTGYNVMLKLCEEIISKFGFDWMTPEDLACTNYEKVKSYLRGLSATKSQYFYYTDTLGLDNLTIR